MSKKTASVFATMVLAFMLIGAAPCHAQTHKYVASFGDDANGCDISAPCRTFGRAVSQSGLYGEVSCLDAGIVDTAVVSISSSITIDCTGFPAVVSFVTIKANGPADFFTVTLRNLTISPLGSASTQPGIDVQSGGAVSVENCVIADQVNAYSFNNDNIGIHIAPTSGTAKVFVIDSVVKNNGRSNVGGGGIVIKPASTAVADVTIERTKIENNVYGFFATSANGGTIRGVVRDSVVSGNSAFGITALGSAAKLLIENTTVTRNQYGLVAENGASVLVSHSSMALNQQGLLTSGGGTLSSFKNNNLSGNTTGNGPFTATIAQQ